MELEVELKIGGHELEIEAKGWRGLVALAGLGLLAASVIRELSRPPVERTWQGVLFGTIPYDLRPPDIRRVAEALWNPADPRIFVPTAFGVGWTVNIGRLWRVAAKTL
jgi:hypothetical protein